VSDLGEHRLAGIDRPMRAWLVLGLAQRRTGTGARFSREGAARTPFVGRERESEVLWHAWEEVRASAGRAVLIRGDAGIGKSRLVEAFHERLGDTPHTWLECAGTPYTQHSAFAPVIELHREALRFRPDQDERDKLDLLEAALVRAGLDDPDAVPLLARLHSVEVPPESRHAGALEGMSPDAVRRRTKAVAGDWLLRIGRQQAVVLLVEDLHWLDPSSVELLGEILERLGETRVLLVLTARPAFAPGWPSPLYTQVTLAGLDRGAATRLVRSGPGGSDLRPHDVETIVARTDGVPLFIEEMTRAALESEREGRAEGARAVPPTLKGLLMARIDRLGPAREVAQVASVLGREFPLGLLREVWDKDAAPLDEGLERIVADDLVMRAGSGADTTYAFRHALIQEAAYESLLKTTRRSYHARIGQAIEQRFPVTLETRPELVAHHYTQAQRLDLAIPLWARAGQRAAQRSENVEAGRHLLAGLACVERLPEGLERLQHELFFRTHLGANLVAVRGYGAEEVERNIARAEELCALIGPSPLLYPVLYNVWVFHLVRADASARRLAAELLTLAAETAPERFLTWGHIVNAITEYWSGNFAQAKSHAERARAHYRPDPESLSLFGDDTGPYGFLYQALPLWFQGFSEQAFALLDQAWAAAEDVGYAFTKAGIRAFRAQLRQLSRQVGEVEKEAAETVSLSSAGGFPLFLATGLVHSGWCRVQRGAPVEGLASVQQGLTLYRSTGARLNLPYLLALLAEAHLAHGDAAAGLAAVDEGLKHAGEQFDRYFVPELHRVRAELLERTGAGADAVEGAYRQALEAAGAMGSMMLELRAAVSWALSAAGTPHAGEARDRVACVYGAFSEGFDLPDLVEARRFLGDRD
jgi:predicted ATPase